MYSFIITQLKSIYFCRQSLQMQYCEYSGSWNLKSYTNNENSTHCTLTPNPQTSIFYLNQSLIVFKNGIFSEIIYLTPETYILYSTLHLGILSFDTRHHGKWVLNFYDEPSAVNCINTLKNSGIEVTDIPELLSTKTHLENTIMNIITNPEFPHFVAKVENYINNTNV